MSMTSFFRRALIAQPVNVTRVAFARSSRCASSDAQKQKEAQLDRTKIDRQSNEYSKSGTDDASAEQENAAFDPNSSNDPKEAMKEAGKGSDQPLDMSPADPEVSSGTSEVSPGADKKMSEGGGGRSGGGDSSGNKSGGSSV